MNQQQIENDIRMFRPNSVYVSWQTHAGLGYFAKATGEVRDAIAERILADWLQANHADIVEHMKQRHESDREFIGKLAEKHGKGMIRDDITF